MSWWPGVLAFEEERHFRADAVKRAKDTGCAAKIIEAINKALLWENSTSRLSVMLKLLANAPAEVFWPVFLVNWPVCDETWNQRNALRSLSRKKAVLAPAVDYYDSDARTFFDSLPNVVTIYRGCSRNRWRGISWTTDEDVAASFAHGHRSIPVPDPVIITADIPREWILAVSVDRDESEVIVDPVTLAGVRLLKAGRKGK
jgi:hypothetical protein